MCYYLDNGHFTVKKKLMYAVQYNVYFYVVVGAIGVIILGSLVITKLQSLR
jgi:hypothetical protein